MFDIVILLNFPRPFPSKYGIWNFRGDNLLSVGILFKSACSLCCLRLETFQQIFSPIECFVRSYIISNLRQLGIIISILFKWPLLLFSEEKLDSGRWYLIKIPVHCNRENESCPKLHETLRYIEIEASWNFKRLPGNCPKHPKTESQFYTLLIGPTSLWTISAV